MQVTLDGWRMKRKPDTDDRKSHIVGGSPRMLTAGIFDVDGVLLASPHEFAWRDALDGFVERVRFTTAMYQAHVTGKPRLDGARSALEALGVSNAERHTAIYVERKQARLETLIQTGAKVSNGSGRPEDRRSDP